MRATWEARRERGEQSDAENTESGAIGEPLLLPLLLLARWQLGWWCVSTDVRTDTRGWHSGAAAMRSVVAICRISGDRDCGRLRRAAGASKSQLQG